MVVLSSRTRPPPQFVDCAGSDAVGRSASRGQLAVAEITEFTFLKDCLSQSGAGEYRGAGRLVKHFLQILTGRTLGMMPNEAFPTPEHERGAS